MYSQGWKTAKKALPVELRLVLYGAIFGLLFGALRLGESVEEATAFGITVFIQATVGLWLSLKLYFFVSHVIEKWLDSFGRRLEALESQLGLGTVVAEDHNSDQPRASARLFVVKWCIFMTSLGMILFVPGTIGAIINFQVNIYSGNFPLLWSVIGLGIALLGLAGQCVHLWDTDRRITRLELQLDLVSSIDGIAWNTKQLGRAFSSTYSIVYKFTGERMTARAGMGE